MYNKLQYLPGFYPAVWLTQSCFKNILETISKLCFVSLFLSDQSLNTIAKMNWLEKSVKMSRNPRNNLVLSYFVGSNYQVIVSRVVVKATKTIFVAIVEF